MGMPTHGKVWSYNHGCRCQDCRDASTERRRQQRSAWKKRLDEAPHGTISGYGNWYCRCELCTARWSLYMQQQRAARKLRQ